MAKNFYPELPEIPYKRTSIDMRFVKQFAKEMLKKYDRKFVVMAYAIFRNESANGLKGVNNNYGGIQGDNARWTNLPAQPIATSVRVDSGGALRRFLCFDDNGYKVSFELFCIKARDRNMVTAKDYFSKWVGQSNPAAANLQNFQSMLDDANNHL